MTTDSVAQESADRPATKFELVWGAAITPPARKLVLLAMADHGNGDGTRIFPAITTIASKCGLAVNSVRAHIATLVDMGVLRRVRSAYRDRGTEYRLDFQALQDIQSAGCLDQRKRPAKPFQGIQSTGRLDKSRYPVGKRKVSSGQAQGIQSAAYNPPDPVDSLGQGGPSRSVSGLTPLPAGTDEVLFEKVARRWTIAERAKRLAEWPDLVARGGKPNLMLGWYFAVPGRDHCKLWPELTPALMGERPTKGKRKPSARVGKARHIQATTEAELTEKPQ